MSEGFEAVVFSGASDDLIEVEGNISGCDEYNGDCATFEITGLRITFAFQVSGVWGVLVSQIDESVPVTARDIRLSADRYTMYLSLLVPPGAHVVKVEGRTL